MSAVTFLQFFSVYCKTGRFLPAYRSNAVPNGFEVTVGPEQEPAAGAAVAAPTPRAPTRATPSTPASATFVNDILPSCCFDQGILRVSVNNSRIDPSLCDGRSGVDS